MDNSYRNHVVAIGAICSLFEHMDHKLGKHNNRKLWVVYRIVYITDGYDIRKKYVSNYRVPFIRFHAWFELRFSDKGLY